MPLRFDEYRIKDGEEAVAEVFNRGIRDLDVRTAAIEEKATDFDAAAAQFVDAGLNRLSDIMEPIVARLTEYASLGALLTASSESDIEVATGFAVFNVVEDDRQKFAPAAYLSFIKTGDPDQAMLGTLVSYNPETGNLTVEIDRTAGSGFHHAWTISAASATDNAEAVGVVNAAKVAAEAARDQAIARRDEAQAARDATLGYKNTAESEADAADDARNQAQIAQVAAEAAKNTTIALQQGFLGTSITAPTTRIGGGALQVGDWYFRNASGIYYIDFVLSIGPVVWTSLTAAALTSVSSFNGRVGGVVATSGDYNAGQVSATAISGLTGTDVQTILASIKTALDAKALAARQIATSGMLSGGGDLSADRTLSVTVASQAEAEAGTITNKGMTPERTKQAILALAPAPAAASTTVSGIVELATSPETVTGSDTVRATTPAGVKAAIDAAVAALINSAPGALDTLKELSDALGGDANFAATVAASIATKLSSSSYTAADVLTKLLTVDGTGTGLDADLLDGLHAAAFAQLAGTNNFTNPQSITLDGVATPLMLTRYGGNANQVQRRANGSLAVPTAVVAADIIGGMSAQGWDGAAFVTGATLRAILVSLASGRITTKWTLGTMNAAGTLADRLTLSEEGDLSVTGAIQSTAAPLALQSTSISAGTGISGGGNLSASRTLSFDTGWGDARYALAATSTSLTAHIGAGGTAHANAVASGAAGFMTGADKAKLDAVLQVAISTPLDDQTFNSSGTYTRPAVAGEWALIELWGGGQGGGRDGTNNTRPGGSGGDYRVFVLPFAMLSASNAITVGAGGTGMTFNLNNNPGNPGGNTTAFGVTALGGCKDLGGDASNVQSGTLNPVLFIVSGAESSTYLRVNPGIAREPGQWTWVATNNTQNPSAPSRNSGGSGGAITNGNVVISPTTPSVAGGAGGAANASGAGTDGSAPGGGGGCGTGGNGGAGAAGRVRIRVY